MHRSQIPRKLPIKKPLCPFCGMPIEKPRELETRRQGDMPVGRCACGAVYACDESGRNVGQALIEALVFGCDMDWDLAWRLLPDEDYQQEIVENYDFLNHLIVPRGVFEGRRIAGVLYFIRFHEEIEEVTSEGVRKRLEKSPPPRDHAPPLPDGTPHRSLSKKDVESCVRDFKIQPILDSATTDKKVIRNLQRLLYSGDDLIRKRTADILGRVSARISPTDSRTISRLLQGLFYAITDTAASSWGAFEAIGEIIARSPRNYAGYTPQLYRFLSDPERNIPALEALERISETRPDFLRKISFHFIGLLPDTDPKIRGIAARILGNLDAIEARKDLEHLQDDPHEIMFYENGDMIKKTVGRLAQKAVDQLSSCGIASHAGEGAPCHTAT